LVPFFKRAIGGHDHGLVFVTPIDHFVEDVGSLIAERSIGNLIEAEQPHFAVATQLAPTTFERFMTQVFHGSGQGRGRSSRPRHSTGRWSLLYSAEACGRSRALEATCWMLLRRYGIVFRELLTRESILPKWRELLMILRRLEDRGEVRGGRFVSGFLGGQFALPVAVESLRAMRHEQPYSETIPVSAADPMNLVGIVVPGERVPANSGKVVGAAVIRMTASGSENASCRALGFYNEDSPQLGSVSRVWSPTASRHSIPPERRRKRSPSRFGGRNSSVSIHKEGNGIKGNNPDLF